MESINNEKKAIEKKNGKKVSKTWEAILKHKGEITFTYPKWVTLLNELKQSKTNEIPG
ncbi:MAG: hypothetical protein VZQ98_00910 [Bacteroidales bacterium]|nr:hypothetical protein [Bacteroidales bacterium]